YGRSIRVPAGGTQREGTPQGGAAAGEDRSCGADHRLELVGADDLSDVHEDRRVHVPQLDDVEEHLVLPGIGHRRREVDPITIERRRTEAHAAGEAQRASDQSYPGCGHVHLGNRSWSVNVKVHTAAPAGRSTL